MKKWIGVMAVAAATAGAAHSAFATILYEPFNYTLGASLDGQVAPDGKMWLAAGMTGTTTMKSAVVTDAAAGTPGINPIPGLAAPQGNALQYGNTTNTGFSERVDIGGYNSGNLYFSMILNVPSLSGLGTAANGAFIAGFGNSVGTQSGAPSIFSGVLRMRNDSDGGTGNASDFDLVFDPVATTVAPNASWDNGLAPGEYLVVGEEIISAASNSFQSQLWVNPVESSFGSNTNIPTPSTPLLSDVGNANKNAGNTGYAAADFALRQASGAAGAPSAINADELRIGESWASVTGVEWTAGGSGGSDWGSGVNWSSDVSPTGQGADVTFGTNSSLHNVTLSSPQTVGTVRFNGNSGYTIGGSAQLEFDTAAAGDLNIGGDVQLNGSTANGAYITGAANPSQIVVTGTASHTISAPVLLNRPLAMTVPAGSAVTLSSVSNNSSGAVWLNLSGGGTASLTPGNASALSGLTGLNVSGGSTLQFSPAHAAITLNTGIANIIQGGGTTVPNTVTNFTLDSTSKIDLTNNDLIIFRNGGDGGIETKVLNAVKSGYDSGKWDGTGIISSTAASTPGATLAFVDDALLTTPITTVDGIDLSSNTNQYLIVKYTWLGDLNLDGVVDNTDLQMMGTINNTNPTNPGYPGWASGDLNYDGVINSDDFALFQLGAAESASRNISVTPEPSAALATAIIGLVAIRRRKTTGQ